MVSAGSFPKPRLCHCWVVMNGRNEHVTLQPSLTRAHRDSSAARNLGHAHHHPPTAQPRPLLECPGQRAPSSRLSLLAVWPRSHWDRPIPRVGDGNVWTEGAGGDLGSRPGSTTWRLRHVTGSPKLSRPCCTSSIHFASSLCGCRDAGKREWGARPAGSGSCTRVSSPCLGAETGCPRAEIRLSERGERC